MDELRGNKNTPSSAGRNTLTRERMIDRQRVNVLNEHRDSRMEGNVSTYNSLHSKSEETVHTVAFAIPDYDIFDSDESMFDEEDSDYVDWSSVSSGERTPRTVIEKVFENSDDEEIATHTISLVAPQKSNKSSKYEPLGVQIAERVKSHLLPRELLQAEDQAKSLKQYVHQFVGRNVEKDPYEHLQLFVFKKYNKRCNHCNEKFSKMSTFYCHLPCYYANRLTHQDIDTNEEIDPTRFKCPTCKLSFDQLDWLARHMESHLPKQFMCNVEGCNKISSSRELAVIHTTHHTRYRMWMCYWKLPGETYFCGKKFSGFSSVTSHIFGHHLQMRPYSCNVCPTNCRSAETLVKHKREVHGIGRPLVGCLDKNCGLQFINNHKLKAHLMKEHPEIQIDYQKLKDETFNQTRKYVRGEADIDEYGELVTTKAPDISFEEAEAIRKKFVSTHLRRRKKFDPRGIVPATNVVGSNQYLPETHAMIPATREAVITGDIQPEKRKRGRPRKHPVATVVSDPSVEDSLMGKTSTNDTFETPLVKRKRGRPRKYALAPVPVPTSLDNLPVAQVGHFIPKRTEKSNQSSTCSYPSSSKSMQPKMNQKANADVKKERRISDQILDSDDHSSSGYATSNSKLPLSAVRFITKKPNLECLRCRKYFSSRSEHLVHDPCYFKDLCTTREEVSQFPCTTIDCPLRFDTLEDLVQHIRSHYDIDYYSCAVCSKCFTYEPQVVHHYSVCHY